MKLHLNSPNQGFAGRDEPGQGQIHEKTIREETSENAEDELGLTVHSVHSDHI